MSSAIFLLFKTSFVLFLVDIQGFEEGFEGACLLSLEPFNAKDDRGFVDAEVGGIFWTLELVPLETGELRWSTFDSDVFWGENIIEQL